MKHGPTPTLAKNAESVEQFQPALFDFKRPPMKHKTRGQGTIEYVLMIAGVLMVVALVGNFLLSNVLVKQTKTLGNESDQIKDYKKQLQQQTGATGPTATPTPSPTP